MPGIILDTEDKAIQMTEAPHGTLFLEKKKNVTLEYSDANRCAPSTEFQAPQFFSPVSYG
jgi:hypothetical protein